MKRTAIAALVLLMVLASVTSAEQFRNNIDQDAYLDRPSFVGWVPNRFIVVLNDDVTVNHNKDMRSTLALSDIDGFSQLANEYGVAAVRPQFPGSDAMQMAASASERALSRHYKVYLNSDNLDEAVAAYEAHPMVARVEKIGVHTVFATPNDPYYDDPPAEFPNDQWHYWDTYGIEADVAWDSEAGDPNVLVGVLDIGTKYDHGDLGGSNPPGPNDGSTNGNIWINTNETVGNGVDDDGNGYVDDILGWDFVERTDWYSYACIDTDCGGADNDPSDGDGHGTHVAGTVGAITNNGYSVAGVAGGFGDGTFTGGGNGSKVVPCRVGYVLDYFIYGATGVVVMDYVAEAMYYMGDLKAAGWNVAAINCSFGTSNSGGISGAADYLISQDVVIVVAAGNGGANDPSYLATRGDCVDVAATDNAGNPASFTNYGAWVDIAAPGVSILSTITDPADPTTDYIALLDGTSMAAPHVAGVMGLLESYNPSLSAADKIAIVTDPANTKAYGGSLDLGAGIVDVAKCIAAAGPSTNPPVADFNGSPTSGDYPLTVQFTDLSTNNPTSWSWDFGDGNTSTAQNPSHTYQAAGTYTVSLTATNAYGSDTQTKTDYITVTAPQPPVADFSGSPTSGAYDLAVQFTDLSTNNPTSWSWDFGDGNTSTLQNPSHTYTAAGTYTVSLTASNAYGSDTQTKLDYITVTEPPSGGEVYADSDLPVSGTVTGNYTNTFTSDNVRQSIQERESGGRPQNRHTYLEHKWTFSVPSNAGVTFYVEGYRNDNTDGDDFTFAYSTNDINYTDLVTIASSTEQVYSATLPTGLSGTVYIRVVDTDQTQGNRSLDYVYVDHMYIAYATQTAPPVADFSGTPTSGDYPLAVQFTDLSTGNPTSWSWDFGDGNTSTAQNPSHTYQAAGTYTVSLTATNAYGSDTQTKTDYITVTTPPQDPPVADFTGTPTSGDYPLAVQFTDASTNNPTSWSWDFGDGNTSTLQNPSHTYQAAGTYTVSLTATNAYGSDTNTKTDYITVTEPPVGGTMYVQSITTTRKTAGPNCSGIATVVIYDSNNQPVANATVTLSATGPVSGTYSGLTDATGTVSVETGKTKSCGGEWCFTVTNVTHASLTYDPNANVATTDCENSAPTAFANGDGSMAAMPTDYSLDQNYPNPFNPTTQISFSLPTGSHVVLEVFNIRGQRVAVLADGSYGAGQHTVTWDASSQPSGVYLYRIVTNEFTDSQKMLLLK